MPASHRIDTVAAIAYHSDVEVCGAPTPFVPDATAAELYDNLGRRDAPSREAELQARKSHDYRWHLGCILPRVPAIIVRTGLR